MQRKIHSDQDLRSIEYDEIMTLEKWEELLKKKLRFPFEAEVVDSDGRLIEVGDKLRVHGIEMIDATYGIIMTVRKGRKKYAFELCSLEVMGNDEEMKQIVNDYTLWFYNSDHL